MNAPHGYGSSPYGPQGQQPPYGQPAQGPYGGGYGGSGFVPGPPPPKKGSSCLMIFLVVMGLGVVLMIGAGYWAWREFGGVANAAKDLANVVLEAQSNPGTKELRELGCDQAAAIDKAKLMEAANGLEREIARKENRDPKPTDFDEAVGTIVTCQMTRTDGPSCEDAAKTYAEAAKPKEDFLLTVGRTRGGSTSCSGLFASDGNRIGDAEPFDMPR